MSYMITRSHQFPAMLKWLLIMLIAIPVTALGQGSISGNLRNADMSIPPDSVVHFFGFIDNTDNEIRLHSSIGTGYEDGNWYDDFQNYQGSAAGLAYRFHFFNVDNNQAYVLSDVIPPNSFQQEDVQLEPAVSPATPSVLIRQALPDGTRRLDWQHESGLTWHIYRREASSEGSLLRIDNPNGDLADPGVSNSFFVDSTSPGSAYSYVVIAESGTQDYSPPSRIITVDPAACCQGRTGNVDLSPDGMVDISDLQLFIEYLFISYEPLPCPEAGNTDGSEDGMVDISDLQVIINYLFITYEPPAPCE